jgi:hypothetical protein
MGSPPSHFFDFIEFNSNYHSKIFSVGLAHLFGMVFQFSIQSGIFKISINFNEVLEKRSEDSKHLLKNN